jgi:hypothetical protein
MSRTVMGRSCASRAIGWKVEPKAWWPELPGKDLSRPYPPIPTQGKKLCKECRKLEVKGIRRYCNTCSKKRKRASNRTHIRNVRSRVGKTGFSLIGAEALTKPDLTGCYGGSQSATAIKNYHDQLGSHERGGKHRNRAPVTRNQENRRPETTQQISLLPLDCVRFVVMFTCTRARGKVAEQSENFERSSA